MWSKLNKVAIAIFVFFFSIFGIQSSYADPGRTWGIEINALTYANQNPTTLTDAHWCNGVCQVPTAIYDINGVSAGDVFTFNISNVTNVNHDDPGTGSYFTLVAWFKNLAGFEVTYTSNNVIVPSWNPTLLDPIDDLVGNAIGGTNGDSESTVAFENIEAQLTLGANPMIDEDWFAGKFGFISYDQYYLFRFRTDGQWVESPAAPAPALAAASIRRSTNLTFKESLYASDTLSDPDGELRKTVDQIMSKYGSLIK
jgi:hypothetical protein